MLVMQPALTLSYTYKVARLGSFLSQESSRRDVCLLFSQRQRVLKKCGLILREKIKIMFFCRSLFKQHSFLRFLDVWSKESFCPILYPLLPAPLAGDHQDARVRRQGWRGDKSRQRISAVQLHGYTGMYT